MGDRVRVFLQARADVRDGEKRDERLIFQPSLRLLVLRGSLVPLGGPDGSGEITGERILDYGYRSLPVYARGLLCSATWKEIDPESPGPDGEGWNVTWADREALDDPDLARRFLPLPICVPNSFPCTPLPLRKRM